MKCKGCGSLELFVWQEEYYEFNDMACYYCWIFFHIIHLLTYDSVLEGIREKGKHILTHDEKAILGDFFYSNYFQPLHEETASIIKMNMHLIRNNNTADLIVEYLHHGLQEVAQNRLYSEMGISTLFFEGTPFPDKLAKAVKKDLDEIYNEIAQLE